MVSHVVFICCFVAMEVILDELQTQSVDIDMRTLSHHVNYLLEGHKALYNQMVVNVNPSEMHVVFNTIDVTNFGRAIAYLTLVYFMHTSEDTTRRAVRLVAAPLKSFDLSAYRIEESFFRRVISRIWS
jgi:carbon starvation protein CstA